DCLLAYSVRLTSLVLNTGKPRRRSPASSSRLFCPGRSASRYSSNIRVSSRWGTAGAPPTTEVESSGLRRLWVEGQAGLGEEAGQQVGSVLDAFEPVAHDRGELVDAGGGEVAQAAFDVGPHPFGGVEVGGVGRDRKSTRLNSSHV